MHANEFPASSTSVVTLLSGSNVEVMSVPLGSVFTGVTPPRSATLKEPESPPVTVKLVPVRTTPLLFERTHVADRVERGQDPQQRRPRGKEETEGIHPKSEFDAGEEPEEHAFRRAACQDLRDHAGDQGEQRDTGCNGPELSQIGPTLARAGDQERTQGRDQDGEQGGDQNQDTVSASVTI